MITTAILVLSAIAQAGAQDKPTDIPKKDLPKSAVCAYCVGLGTMMTEAKVTHGLTYKGKPYYFHSKEMRDSWARDPIAFLPPVLPRPMDDIDLKESTGKVWNSESFKGKTVLVDFWATWCEPCKEMMPVLHDLYRDRKGKGLDELLSVSVDAKRNLYDSFIKKHPFPNPVLYDDKKTFNKWHVLALPTLLLIKDGQVVGQWSGTVERQAIEKALGDKK